MKLAAESTPYIRSFLQVMLLYGVPNVVTFIRLTGTRQGGEVFLRESLDENTRVQ